MRCTHVIVAQVGVQFHVTERVWGFSRGRNLEDQVCEMWQSLSVGARWKSRVGPVWRSEVGVVGVDVEVGLSLVWVQDVSRPGRQSKCQVDVGERISIIEEGSGVMVIGEVDRGRDSGEDVGFWI